MKRLLFRALPGGGGGQETPKLLVIKILTPTEAKLALQKAPAKKISELRHKV